MGRLAGKVAIVTGAARGMGAATARLFATEGAKVALGDVLDGECRTVAEEIGEAALALHLDVSVEDDWAQAVRATEERFGAPNVLVNNAGILLMKSIEETTLKEYMKVIRVNQAGVFLGMRTAIPAMRRAGGGSIVNVSSSEGLRGMPMIIAYTASKFAVRGMSKGAAAELGQYGIRVNSVHPGAIDTSLSRAAGMNPDVMNELFRKTLPGGRIGAPEDVANMVLFLASDESSYVTGAEFAVDGGATALTGGYPTSR